MGLPEETARKDAENLAMVNEDETIAYTNHTVLAEALPAHGESIAARFKEN